MLHCPFIWLLCIGATTIYRVELMDPFQAIYCDRPRIIDDRIIFSGCSNVWSYGFRNTIYAYATSINEFSPPIRTFESKGLNIHDIPQNLTQLFPQLKGVVIEGAKDEYKAGMEPFHTLERLTIRNSGIIAIDDHAFAGFDNLRYLSLANNYIPVFNRMILVHLPNLNHLDLSHNHISWGDHVFKKCSLIHIDLSYNDIHSINLVGDACISNLQVLDMRYNPLHTVHFDIPLGSLVWHTAKLSMTAHMKTIMSELGEIGSMKSIELEGSQIMTFDASCLSPFNSLEYLSITNSMLYRIPRGNNETYDKVVVLNLASNLITKLAKHDFAHWDGLKVLVLNANFIWKIEPHALAYLENLEQLHLASNYLTTITHSTVSGLKNLKKLDLFNNEIDSIQTGSFTLLPVIEEVILERNKLKIIHPVGLAHSQTFRLLNVKNNLMDGSEAFLQNMSFQVIV